MPASDFFDRLIAGWRAWALIALISVGAALPGVFSIPPLDRDESRFAQASLQMLETGDFVRIAMQDQPRNKKPVGIYWLQAASVTMFSRPEARAIWAYRLPSVMGALIAALATFWAGQALLARRTAFVGAALFACSILIAVEGMTAKTDAVLCGLTTLAMAVIARLHQSGETGSPALVAPARRSALVFWAALAGGVLIKGPITPLAAGGTLATLYMWERRANWMRVLAWWPGPLLALLIVSPWGVAIWIATHGRFFADAIGGDLANKVAGGDDGHAGPPLYHFALVWIAAFPASIGLVGALRLVARAARAPRLSEAERSVRLLTAWLGPLWVVFELLPTKLPHYVLPAYPALSLLCASALEAMFVEDWRRVRFASRLVLVVDALALIAVCAALSALLPGDAGASGKRALQTALVALVAAIPILVVGVRTANPRVLAGVGCAIALCFAFVARERILPRARGAFVSTQASEALARAGLHPRLSAPYARLTVIGDNEPSLVFLTRTDTRLASGADAAQEVKAGDVVLVEARQRAAFDAGLAARGLSFAPQGDRAEGVNYSKGAPTLLQPGRVIAASRARAP